MIALRKIEDKADYDGWRKLLLLLPRMLLRPWRMRYTGDQGYPSKIPLFPLERVIAPSQFKATCEVWSEEK